MRSASADEDAEQLAEERAALNDERDRAEIRDALQRELLEHELKRLDARLRAPKENAP